MKKCPRWDAAQSNSHPDAMAARFVYPAPFQFLATLFIKCEANLQVNARLKTFHDRSGANKQSFQVWKSYARISSLAC